MRGATFTLALLGLVTFAGCKTLVDARHAAAMLKAREVQIEAITYTDACGDLPPAYGTDC